MKKQRTISQMKEQDKTPEKQLNEVEIGNFLKKKNHNNDSEDDPGPQKKKKMEAKMEKMQEMFNKDLGELKNKQTEMNNTITEKKKYTRRNQ